MPGIESISRDELSILRSINTYVVRVGIKAVDGTFLLVIERNSQVMRCSSLGIESDVILLGGMNVLAGLTDTDIRLDNCKTVLLRKCISRATIAMFYQPGFGGRIGEVYLQIV